MKAEVAARLPALAVARAHLAKSDPVMRGLVEAQPSLDPRAWLATLPAMDTFGVLLWQIIGQQISVVAARAILRRTQAAFGEHIPTPHEVLAATLDVFLAAGWSRRKVQTLRALAAEFVAGRISAEGLAMMSDVEIEAHLTTITGIGPWTVHGFLIIALDRPDVVLPGDVALRRAIQRAYQLDRRPSSDEVQAMAEAWRPYRTLASAYLFASAAAAKAAAAAIAVDLRVVPRGATNAIRSADTAPKRRASRRSIHASTGRTRERQVPRGLARELAR